MIFKTRPHLLVRIQPFSQDGKLYVRANLGCARVRSTSRHAAAPGPPAAAAAAFAAAPGAAAASSCAGRQKGVQEGLHQGRLYD